MAVNRDKLFDGIENGAMWDAGIVFNRTNGIPLDKWSIFKTYTEAEEYAQSNPVAYPGQLIAVVPVDDNPKVYLILNTGELQPLGSIITDSSLSQAGQAADAKVTGDRLDALATQTASYPIVEGTTNLYPRIYYNFGEVDQLTLTLMGVDDSDDRTAEYCFEFIPSSAFTDLVITPAPKWAHQVRYIAGMTYQVSILRGVGVMISA